MTTEPKACEFCGALPCCAGASLEEESIEEPKACPFCATKPRMDQDQVVWCINQSCPNVDMPYSLAEWNHRPGEDAARREAMETACKAVEVYFFPCVSIALYYNREQSMWMTRAVLISEIQKAIREAFGEPV